MTPAGHVMSGPQLVATVLRSGGGRRPVAWCLYYSLWAENQGARSGALFPSRHAAVLAARQWCARFGLPARYSPLPTAAGHAPALRADTSPTHLPVQAANSAREAR